MSELSERDQAYADAYRCLDDIQANLMAYDEKPTPAARWGIEAGLRVLSRRIDKAIGPKPSVESESEPLTRPQPRLPELAGMTEAGFNRVVAMMTWEDFAPRDRFGDVCGADFPMSWVRYDRWLASLPKTRNKKQRKADAKRAALYESAREQFDAIFPPVHCCECNKKLELFDDYQRDGKRCCYSCYHNQTPLQRLLKFAAETDTPVSFEIAEAAMKGEW
jgi:hypothetical protein